MGGRKKVATKTLRHKGSGKRLGVWMDLERKGTQRHRDTEEQGKGGEK